MLLLFSLVTYFLSFKLPVIFPRFIGKHYTPFIPIFVISVFQYFFYKSGVNMLSFEFQLWVP
jgi:hypothetical protein